MPVPEISVHKDSNSLHAEYKVRFSESRVFSPPATYAVHLEQLDQTQFGRHIPAPFDARHYIRTFPFIKYVSHSSDASFGTRFGKLSAKVRYLREKPWEIAGKLVERL